MVTRPMKELASDQTIFVADAQANAGARLGALDRHLDSSCPTVRTQASWLIGFFLALNVTTQSTTKFILIKSPVYFERRETRLELIQIAWVTEAAY